MLSEEAREPTAPRWVRLWFRGAAIYGAVALVLSLFGPPPTPVALLPQLAFTFTALAFQWVFWTIGGDPVRHRPLMLAGVAEKVAFGVPALALAAGWGGSFGVVPFALIDLALGVGFWLAWRATAPR